MTESPFQGSSAEALARRFHEVYEDLAPSFGYETRPESAVKWENVPLKNKRLMVAVTEVVLGEIQAVLDASRSLFIQGADLTDAPDAAAFDPHGVTEQVQALADALRALGLEGAR